MVSVVVLSAMRVVVISSNARLVCFDVETTSGLFSVVVVVNEGVARNLSTSTLKDDAYAFIFDQQGLMGSLSIEGTKITPIKR